MFMPLFGNNGSVPTIFGTPVAYVDGRILPTTGAGSEVRFVAGDWSQLEWGTWGDLTIEAFDQGSADGYNAIQQNLTLVRAEVWLGYKVINDAAFATLAE